MDRVKYLLSFILWPLLLGVCVAITYYGFAKDETVLLMGVGMNSSILYFNVAYLFLIVSLWRLEIWMPHEREWHKPDGQNFASIMHTLSSKGTVQGLLLYGGTIGLADMFDNGTLGFGLWPKDWPMWGQVILALVAAEFGLYWAHRWAHERAFLWRFHAVHHSVTKL